MDTEDMKSFQLPATTKDPRVRQCSLKLDRLEGSPKIQSTSETGAVAGSSVHQHPCSISEKLVVQMALAWKNKEKKPTVTKDPRVRPCSVKVVRPGVSLRREITSRIGSSVQRPDASDSKNLIMEMALSWKNKSQVGVNKFTSCPLVSVKEVEKGCEGRRIKKENPDVIEIGEIGRFLKANTDRTYNVSESSYTQEIKYEVSDGNKEYCMPNRRFANSANTNKKRNEAGGNEIKVEPEINLISVVHRNVKHDSIIENSSLTESKSGTSLSEGKICEMVQLGYHEHSQTGDCARIARRKRHIVQENKHELRKEVKIGDVSLPTDMETLTVAHSLSSCRENLDETLIPETCESDNDKKGNKFHNGGKEKQNGSNSPNLSSDNITDPVTRRDSELSESGTTNDTTSATSRDPSNNSTAAGLFKEMLSQNRSVNDKSDNIVRPGPCVEERTDGGQEQTETSSDLQYQKSKHSLRNIAKSKSSINGILKPSTTSVLDEERIERFFEDQNQSETTLELQNQDKSRYSLRKVEKPKTYVESSDSEQSDDDDTSDESYDDTSDKRYEENSDDNADDTSEESYEENSDDNADDTSEESYEENSDDNADDTLEESYEENSDDNDDATSEGSNEENSNENDGATSEGSTEENSDDYERVESAARIPVLEKCLMSKGREQSEYSAGSQSKGKPRVGHKEFVKRLNQQDKEARALEDKWKYKYGEEETFSSLVKHKGQGLTNWRMCVYNDSEAFRKCFEFVEWNCFMRCIVCNKIFQTFAAYLRHNFARTKCSKKNRGNEGGKLKACVNCKKYNMIKDAFVRHMLLLNSYGNAGSAYVPKPKFLDSSKDSSLATTESGTCTEPSPTLNADVTKNTDVCDNNGVSDKSKDLGSDDSPISVNTENRKDLGSDDAPISVNTENRKDLGSDDAPISVSTENRKHLGCDNVSIRFGTENRKDLDSDNVPLPVSTENRKDLECDVPLTVGFEKNKDLRCDDVPLPVGTQKHNDFECDVTLPVGTEKHNDLECDSPLPVGTEKHKDLGCDDLSTPDVAENRKDLGCDKWNKKSTHICDEELVTKDADWLNTFEPGFQCKVCKNTTHVFPSIYEAIRHIKRTHTHEEYGKFCYRIMLYYKGKEKLCVKRKANTDEFLCPICGLGLQSQDSLHSHLASMHKGISAKKLGLKDHINICPHCGKSYSVHRHAQFRRHWLTHTSPVKCKKCNIVLKNKSVYKC